MHSLYDVLAPAKLNLFLHITGRRDDGYHLLQSVFMLVDWCDTLHFERNATGRIARTSDNNNAGNTLPSNDLCVQAATLLQKHTGCSYGVDITLEKHIPTEAGMGGGSSDAASCLIALNRLWNTRLNKDQLAALGLQLGADVPFFIHGSNAWVEGIGEQTTPVELPPARFLIVKPSTGVATPQLFSHPDLTRNHNFVTMSDFKKSCYQFGSNDLQDVAVRINPDIAKAIGFLQNMQLKPKMTGSGSSVFAYLPNRFFENCFGQSDSNAQDSHQSEEKWLKNIQQKLPDCTIKICNNLQVHPLTGW